MKDFVPISKGLLNFKDSWKISNSTVLIFRTRHLKHKDVNALVENYMVREGRSLHWNPCLLALSVLSGIFIPWVYVCVCVCVCTHECLCVISLCLWLK